MKISKPKKFKLFRYSGNKTDFPEIDVSNHKRIVETFAGSMGFSLQYDLPALGIDYSLELINLLKWLQTVSDKNLDKLRQYEGQKIDIRKIPGLSDEERTYLRINIASVMVGQLSSWTIYPQNKLPIEATKKARKKIKNWKFKHGTYLDYIQKEGDLAFIDPPYLNTSGNYNENSLDMETFLKWEKSLWVPHIITYVMPIRQIKTKWKCWLEKKIPNVRLGGYKIRKDYYTMVTP